MNTRLKRCNIGGLGLGLVRFNVPLDTYRPYLTLTENLKLQLSPGLVASYDFQPGNGVGLFWDKHTHTFTYLLTPALLKHWSQMEMGLSYHHHQ